MGALDLRGWEVTLDGERGPLFKPVSRPAAPPIAWHALPNKGLKGYVSAMAVSGDDLYVGGGFYQTGDGSLTDLYNIARYDTTAGVWHALPNQGLDDNVRALAVSGDDLYVGGFFTQTGDGSLTDLGSIARYDITAGTWHTLPNRGLSNDVYALTVSGGDLYVGGRFTRTGDGTLTDLRYIARYDTTAGTWHALSNQGLNGDVTALAVSGDDLYVGGEGFDQTGDGSLKNLGSIARYDITAGAWHALPNQGLNLYVYTLAVFADDLYVGGFFHETGDGTLKNLSWIARYDTTAGAWHALPNRGLVELYGGGVRALAVYGGDLFVGGFFTQTGDGTLTHLGHIARYDTTAGTWHALPNWGLYGPYRSSVGALGVSGDDLYVGGGFETTGDGSLTDLGSIVHCPIASCTLVVTPVVNVYLPLVFAK